MFDVGALLEDAETKNAALERVEELEENISHVSASQEKVPWGQDQPTVVGMECRNEQLQIPSGSFKEGRYVSYRRNPSFVSTYLPVPFLPSHMHWQWQLGIQRSRMVGTIRVKGK